MKRFFSFCSSTSLHGWPHIPQTSAFGKIFWTFTIVAMAGLAVFLCSRYQTCNLSNIGFAIILTNYKFWQPTVHKILVELVLKTTFKMFRYHVCLSCSCFSTMRQFTTSTVSTNLVSSTEPIGLATFQKLSSATNTRLGEKFII